MYRSNGFDFLTLLKVKQNISKKLITLVHLKLTEMHFLWTLIFGQIQR